MVSEGGGSFVRLSECGGEEEGVDRGRSVWRRMEGCKTSRGTDTVGGGWMELMGWNEMRLDRILWGNWVITPTNCCYTVHVNIFNVP